MNYVIADPEMMTAAAADLATIGSNVNAAHMVAAARTTSVIPAAADEVSAGIAHLFSQHAANYQALAGQAAAFQEQFVQHLTAGAFSYANIEAAIAAALRPVIDAAIATGLPLLDSGLNAVGQLVLAINVALPPSLAMLGAAVVQFLEPYLLIGAFFGFILFAEFLAFIFVLPQLLAFFPQLLLAYVPPLLAPFGI
jgi:predicted RecA/RadA family phage recombinase